MSHATLGQTNSNGGSSENITTSPIPVCPSLTALHSQRPATHLVLGHSRSCFQTHLTKYSSFVSFASVHLITSLAQTCSCTISLSCHTKPQRQEMKPVILLHCENSVASILLYFHSRSYRQNGALWLNQTVHQYSFCISPFLQHRPIPREFSWIFHLHQDIRFHLSKVSK